jgi:hypothetical protein
LLHQFLSVAQNRLKSLCMACQPRLQVSILFSFLFFCLEYIRIFHEDINMSFFLYEGSGGEQK